MRDFTLENLTETVLEEYRDHTPNERTRTVLTSMLKHLHAFVKEAELSEAEWFSAIDFLTRTGQLCDDKRQEFILLSDVLGVSMLVDAINHPRGGKGTESTVLGPFYVANAPLLPNGSSVIRKDIGAELVLARGRVTDQKGDPIAGAVVDIWQTSESGFYDVQDSTAPEYNLRGKFNTDDKGEYAFITERPQSYSVPTDGPVGELLAAAGRHAMRPAHIHFIVSADGYQPCTTHVFADGDQYLNSDAVFATKSSLIAEFTECVDQDLGIQYGLQVPFTVFEYDFRLLLVDSE